MSEKDKKRTGLLSVLPKSPGAELGTISDMSDGLSDLEKELLAVKVDKEVNKELSKLELDAQSDLESQVDSKLDAALKERIKKKKEQGGVLYLADLSESELLRLHRKLGKLKPKTYDEMMQMREIEKLLAVNLPKPKKQIVPKDIIFGPSDPSLNKSPRMQRALDRKCSSWIATYLKYTENTESPELFHIWSAVSAISGALGHNVCLKRGLFTLYPNHYVILVSESAKCRKSTAIELAILDFLDKIPDANVLSGTLTAAGLTDQLQLANEVTVEAVKNNLSGDASGRAFVLASELTYSLHDESERKRILEYFTDLYGGKKKVDDITRGAGRKTIHKACLNLGGATTPKGVAEIVSKSLVGMGIIGRVIWVFANKARKKVAWPEKTAEMDLLEEKLMHDLRAIARLKGHFTVSQEAADFYQNWYENDLPNPDEASQDYEKEYLARKQTHLLKLAMVLSIDESNELAITIDHFKKAMRILEFTEVEMWKAFDLVGSDSQALALDILNYIASKSNGAATHSQVTSRFKSRIQHRMDLKSAIDLLRDENLVSQRLIAKKVSYLITEEGAAKLVADRVTGGRTLGKVLESERLLARKPGVRREPN